MNRKQTIMFVIVNAIAVSISIQVVHGIEIHELNTVEYEENLGELNSLIASYTQIKEYCSIPYNVDSYDGSANNGIDACINFLDNFRKHFKQAFNESMTDIEVLRKIEQSQDDLGQNLEGLLK